jgi:hypothetical protein
VRSDVGRAPIEGGTVGALALSLQLSVGARF